MKHYPPLNTMKHYLHYTLIISYSPVALPPSPIASPGAQVFGNFRSFKYFPPHGSKVMDEVFRFSDRVQETAHAIAEAIPGRISDFFRQSHGVDPGKGLFLLWQVEVRSSCRSRPV